MRLILAFLLPASTLAIAFDKRWSDVQVKHAWEAIPSGWIVHSEDVPPDHVLNLSIGLKQHKFDQLVGELYQVSDPKHVRYGAHLSKDEIHRLVAPHGDTVSIVEEWLTHNGINISTLRRSAAGDHLYLTIPLRQVERMLSTKYKLFHHPISGAYAVRTMSYLLPSVVLPHVSVIAPTTHFGQGQPLRPATPLRNNVRRRGSPEKLVKNDLSAENKEGSARVPSSCNETITPTCLRALYNFDGYVPQAADRNKIGITSYLNEFGNDADLQIFFEKFYPEAIGATVEHVQVNGGGNDQSRPGGEANLNTQYTMSLTFPTPNILYSTGGSPPYIPDESTINNTNEPYLEWLNHVLALDDGDLPHVFSTSYGDVEQTVPRDYAETVCSMFAQLGARGASLVFGSGNGGVGSGQCETNDGTNMTRFQPNFPASCPFVTVVGATMGIDPEVAAEYSENEYWSGGGFSNYFTQPSYQSEAVSCYLDNLGSQYEGLFNTTGRAYPDISAQGGINFQIILNRTRDEKGGTSASTPVVASIVTLLNDFRIASGKSPLGFINPLLYSHGIEGLNDIVFGSNPGCGTDGFSCGPGWDAVTGLGTLDFRKLQAIVADL